MKSSAHPQLHTVPGDEVECASSDAQPVYCDPNPFRIRGCATPRIKMKLSAHPQIRSLCIAADPAPHQGMLHSAHRDEVE